MEKICNWGLYPKVDAEVFRPATVKDLEACLRNDFDKIARGNGRCYGDSSLGSHIVSCLNLNKILHFDTINGIIKAESGVLLDDILRVTVPKGFFLPVTPGTKFITLGGAVASNIHGKNHHKDGALSKHILELEMMNEHGEIVICNPLINKDFFVNTIGGMGLTGIIVSVTIQLKKIDTAYIQHKSIKARNLEEILDLFDQYNHYTYSVAWIDCLIQGKAMGRSILMLGEHASLEELEHSKQKQNPLLLHPDKQINVPFMFPTFALNNWSIRAFNFLYYNKQRQKEKNHLIHYNPFFYPLDGLGNWNRIYGRNGFTQYQFAIPFEKGREGITEILKKISSSGAGSFLAVLKTFGESDALSSPLSFPMPGYTLALDFKLSPKVLALLDVLDEIVMKYGGKLYLSKDCRMKKAVFDKTYPERLQHPALFKSLQSERLEI